MIKQVNIDQLFAFEKARILSNFEAYQIFDQSNESSNQSDNRKRLFDKAKQYATYCQQFNNQSQLDAARDAVKMLLKEFSKYRNEDHNMTEEEAEKEERQVEYDTVMLLNLCPDTVDDARAFIQSLSGESEDNIQKIIDQLSKFRI